jgi:hypothetical protein
VHRQSVILERGGAEIDRATLVERI